MKVFFFSYPEKVCNFYILLKNVQIIWEDKLRINYFRYWLDLILNILVRSFIIFPGQVEILFPIIIVRRIEFVMFDNS